MSLHDGIDAKKEQKLLSNSNGSINLHSRDSEGSISLQSRSSTSSSAHRLSSGRSQGQNEGDYSDMMTIELNFGRGRADTIHVKFDDNPEDLANVSCCIL